jgi:TolB-like protein
MIFSKNFSGSRFSLPGCLFLLVFSGCAVAPVTAPGGRETLLPLTIESFSPDKAPPRAAGMETVRWRVQSNGGAGERTFSFRVSDGKTEKVMQDGISASWDWAPSTPGTYRVKVAVRDSLGNVAESGWSPGYTVVPMLEVSPVTPDKGAPQVAEMAKVRWKVDATGGVGKLTYAFRVSDGMAERTTQDSESASWVWVPSEPGTYRVKVVVRDATGTEVENGWSPGYTIVPRLEVTSLSPDRASPQAAEMATVRWNVEAKGGVGERMFSFRVSDGKAEKVLQDGASASWGWSPTTPGTYRVKVAVRDSLENVTESGWSPEYVVVPRLAVKSFSPDKGSPQAAGMATIRWKVVATGGAGNYLYEFRTTDGRAERAEQSGELPTWDWLPKVPGSYKVKAVVRDVIGNTSESEWSLPYEVAPPLVVSLLPPDKASPQAAGMTTVRWKVEATGGVGKRTVEFRIADGNGEKLAQGGASDAWDWSPLEPGTYRVKALVRDAIGNTLDSGWSSDFVLTPKLKLLAVTPDKAPPQTAGSSTVRWKAEATGGVGEREYWFRISKGGGETAEQRGPSPTWDWSPRDPGIYRLRVVVRDATGNTVDSGWSPEYRIDVTAGPNSLIAIMPVENLTGMPIPVQEVRKSLLEAMKRQGIHLLPEDALEGFLDRHRVRYTGGLNRKLGEAFREETKTDAVLFVSLEMFDETVPPKTALVARLVSTHEKGNILWMDGVGMAGNDAPGFLLLGLVDDPGVLWVRARDRLVNSLTEYLSGKEPQDARKAEKKFLPKSFHGVAPKTPDGKETVSIAVLPFRNESTRRNAGEILALHFTRELSRSGNLEVVEPGEVRQVLLRSRTIMEGGLSLPQADILHAALDVDLVLTGIVMAYQDFIGGIGNPKVEFSVRVFDMKTRQIAWASTSYNEGDDGVFFFNLGKVNTAHGIASGMVRSVVERMDAIMEGRMGQTAVAVPSGIRRVGP